MTSSELKDMVHKWVCVDGVLAPKTIPLSKKSRRVSCSSSDSVFCGDQFRDPFHSVLELHGALYIVGGTRRCDGGLFSRALIRFDPRSDDCVRLADMSARRGDFVASTVNDHIYVFGGRNRHGVMDISERYNPSTDKWDFVSSMPEPTYMAAGVTMNDKIFVSGGFNNYEAKGNLLRYDPKEDKWCQMNAPMMAGRGFHIMLKGSDERLWVIGGMDNPFAGRSVWEVEAFDPNSETWEVMSHVLPTSLFDSTIRLNGMVDEEGNICVFAVTDPDNYPKLKYQPAKRTWSEIEGLDDLSQLDVDI